MNTPSLFDVSGHVRASDPPTSHAAAQSIEPVLGSQCLRVLQAVVQLEARTERTTVGVTAYEALLLLSFDGKGWQQSVIARRLTDLREKGCVRDSGVTRPGGSGRQLIAWTATDKGRGFVS